MQNNNKNNLLIIYSKNPTEVYSRKSALGSYIHWLADNLSKEYNIYLNGDLLNSEKVVQNSTLPPKSKLNFIKKIIPNFFKILSRKSNIKKNNDSIINHIISSSTTFVGILEFYSTWSNCGFEISKKLKIPLYLVLDAPMCEEFEHFYSTKLFNRSIRQSELQSLLQAKSIVVYNEPMKKYVINIGISDSEKIKIHQNIDFTRIANSSKDNPTPPINICFIGSFLKWHKVDLLIEAFNQLASENGDIELYLIGDGMEFQNCKLQAEKSIYKKRIHLTGFLDGQDLENIKNKMHIGVMPGSNWYGVPNKIFEYLSSGMSVVTISTPAIENVFNKTLGIYLFEGGNQNIFITKIKEAIQDRKINTELWMNISNNYSLQFNKIKTQEFYNYVLLHDKKTN